MQRNGADRDEKKREGNGRNERMLILVRERLHNYPNKMFKLIHTLLLFLKKVFNPGHTTDVSNVTYAQREGQSSRNSTHPSTHTHFPHVVLTRGKWGKD